MEKILDQDDIVMMILEGAMVPDKAFKHSEIYSKTKWRSAIHLCPSCE
jgi:hypothetical protein